MAETELLQILVMSHAIHSFILLSGATTHWALHGPIASHLLKFIELSALSSEACGPQHYSRAIVPFPPDYLNVQKRGSLGA